MVEVWAREARAEAGSDCPTGTSPVVAENLLPIHENDLSAEHKSICLVLDWRRGRSQFMLGSHPASPSLPCESCQLHFVGWVAPNVCRSL